MSTLSGAAEIEAADGFRNMMQTFDATPYRGKNVRFSAALCFEGGSSIAGSRAQLWLRVDRPEGAGPGFFDNMSNRAVASRAWDRYEINGRIDDDAEWINIGVMAFGDATVWIDDARFEIIDEDEPPAG
jgi:hypothetical protein